jgi:UDP-GlcNAc3NAcA epimerase
VKLLTIVGARPQFIKAAAVSRAIEKTAGRATEVIIHTGQHFDANMSRVFFEELLIPEPKYNLGISGGPHGEMTGRMLAAIEKVILDERPDVVVIHGDTNSTLAGALAAAKLHVPIGHVEAGLRSFNRRMPEEINRVVADHLADRLFCPTPVAVENLRREGITKGVSLTGDVMYDSALFYTRMANERSSVLDRLGLKEGGYYLATIHRAENTDDVARLTNILAALEGIGQLVVLPVHPRTRQALGQQGLTIRNIQLVAPVPYLDMLRLENGARVILTDSGGVQKEAYFAGVPCITLRDETEWVELVDAGWNRVVGTDPGRIAEAVAWAESMDHGSAGRSLYGDGHAADKIVSLLLGDAPETERPA